MPVHAITGPLQDSCEFVVRGQCLNLTQNPILRKARQFSGSTNSRAEPFFLSNSSNDVPKRGEWFDGMLCIVVVPWDTVIFEKGEQLVSVLLQARLDFRRSLTL